MSRIVIKNKEYPIFKSFTILREAWEMDNDGFIVKDETVGKYKLILTSHERPYLADIKELDELITEHKTVVDEMLIAKQMLEY